MEGKTQQKVNLKSVLNSSGKSKSVWRSLTIKSCGSLEELFPPFYQKLSAHSFRFSEQIMSAEKFPSIFLRQMETFVYLEYSGCWSTKCNIFL